MTPTAVTSDRHRWRFCVILLTLGALTTVATAWLLVFDLHRAANPLRFAVVDSDPSHPNLIVARRDSFGGLALVAASPLNEQSTPANQTFALDVVVPGWARSELLHPAWPPLAPAAARAMLATGLPLPSMWSSYDQQPSADYWWFKARSGLVIGPSPTNPMPFALLSPCERTLPLRIAWRGFLIDTLFWSALWAAILLTPPALRRAWRRRRGQCLSCGYDRRGLEPANRCPECGQAAQA